MDVALRLGWCGRPRACRLRPPPSKSHALRVLMLRHARGQIGGAEQLAGGAADDVATLAKAVEALDAGGPEIAIDAGLGGAPLRFMLALAAVSPGLRCTVDAAEPLRRRPHGPLLSALRGGLGGHGLALSAESWPLVVDTTRLDLPQRLSFALEPTSSQFLSALALAAASAVGAGRCRVADIELLGEPASPAYAELTAGLMREAGFALEVSERRWRLGGFSGRPWEPEIPPDWSAAACLAVWAWRCGGSVEVGDPAGHPDGIVLDVLSAAGLRVEIGSGSSLRVGGVLARGLRASARNCPDLIPTLGALALAAPGESRFESVGVLRDKESDRLRFLVDLASAAGGEAVLSGDQLIVRPAGERGGSVAVETEHDHRRAMAGSLMLALGWPEVVFDDPGCVSKSFPGYWRELEHCGVRLG